MSRDLPCPKCGARAGEKCLTSSGRILEVDHPQRDPKVAEEFRERRRAEQRRSNQRAIARRKAAS